MVRSEGLAVRLHVATRWAKEREGGRMERARMKTNMMMSSKTDAAVQQDALPRRTAT